MHSSLRICSCELSCIRSENWCETPIISTYDVIRLTSQHEMPKVRIPSCNQKLRVLLLNRPTDRSLEFRSQALSLALGREKPRLYLIERNNGWMTDHLLFLMIVFVADRSSQIPRITAFCILFFCRSLYILFDLAAN